jgi:hypothetical protein
MQLAQKTDDFVALICGTPARGRFRSNSVWSGGHDKAQHVGGGGVPGAVHGTARGQIVEAPGIVHRRRDRLESLKASCKPAP